MTKHNPRLPQSYSGIAPIAQRSKIFGVRIGGDREVLRLDLLLGSLLFLLAGVFLFFLFNPLFIFF